MFVSQLNSNFDIDWMKILNISYTGTEFANGIQWRYNPIPNLFAGSYTSSNGVYFFYQSLSTNTSFPSTNIYMNYLSNMQFHSFYTTNTAWDLYQTSSTTLGVTGIYYWLARTHQFPLLTFSGFTLPRMIHTTRRQRLQ